MVEVEGKLNQIPISILIDPGAILSYISHNLVEKCKLSVENFARSQLVQLATGAKIKVISFVKNCAVTMDEFETSVKLNVLPLGSQDMLIGMDWLEHHRVVLNFFDKTFTCINNDRELINVKGIPRETSISQIFALQLKGAVRKGYKSSVVTVINEENTNNRDKIKLEDIPILREYLYVFLKEIMGLPLKQELDFTFGADSISEEFARFSPFMVSLRKNIVFIISCA